MEYAVVLGAMLCVVMALAALGGTFQDGTFAQHAVMAASHVVQDSVGGAIDAFCF